MSITPAIFNFEREFVKRNFVDGYKGLVICQLGNQFIHGTKRSTEFRYRDLEVGKFVSIDINGKDGSVPLNLDEPVPDEFTNKFQLITNYGVSEHVNNQKQLFKNIHDMCEIGGVMIHAVPLVGNWPGHCRYRYSLPTPREGAILVHRGLINSFIPAKDKCYLSTCVLMKTGPYTSEPFLVIEDSGDKRRTGNYANNIRKKKNIR